MSDPEVVPAFPQPAWSGATQPRVWAILEGRAGDDAQLVNLAQALGWPTEFKQPGYSLPEVARHRIRGDLRRRSGRAEVFEPPWPDLVLTIGGRSVVAATRIRQASGGRARVVCLGRPWAPLHWFDLVVTTPQYRLPRRPNVLQNALPLNGVPDIVHTPATRRWQARLERLPAPHIAVLVGGNNGTYVLDADAARALGQRVSEFATAHGGSLLVATSPRTNPAAAEALRAALTAPNLCYLFHADPADNPYSLFVNRAAHLVVTSDSASMLADACGAPGQVHLYDLPASRMTRTMAACSRMLPHSERLQRWREALVTRGCWVPRKDLTRIHERLIAAGRLARLGTARLPVENVSDLDLTLQRIRQLLSAAAPTRGLDLQRAAS